MNIKSLIVGAAALAGLAAISAPASAMPVGAVSAAPGAEVEKVVLVCNAYGRCWRRPPYRAPYYGYYGRPRYYGYYGPRYRYGYRW